MARSISISFRYARDVQTNATVTCTVTAATEMDSNVFVLRRISNSASGLTFYSVFERVASPADFSALPTTQPFTYGGLYRAATFSRTFTLPAEAAEFKQGVIDSVNLLIQSLNDEAAGITETVVLTGAS